MTYSPIMGSSAPNEPVISTPPKLSLFSLASKQSTLPDGLTPPPNTVATIPFLWEEAPGKPRRTISNTYDDPPKSSTVRSLDLPPRLTITASPFNNENQHCDKLANNVGIGIIPSPTTVLSGPYEGIYASESKLRPPEKVVISSKSKGKMKMSLGKLMRKERSPVKLSSWRWESFRDIVGNKVERTP
ncbi:uncharacterized protein [Rutidosis leptorrhynchoides]|uniref:uncharacterized protein n=1 Tax=Rutidosis leptorrhynchoides TaxID=125765 RepID=UPI003A98FAC8